MPDRSRVERLEVHVGGRSRRQLMSDLSSLGVLLNDHAETLLKDVVLDHQASRSVVVTERTVAELGLPTGATLTRIFQSAQQHDFSLCPADTGPYLRMALNEQVPSRDSVMSSGRAPDGAARRAGCPQGRPSRRVDAAYKRIERRYSLTQE